jgi:hypothetical protein
MFYDSIARRRNSVIIRHYLAFLPCTTWLTAGMRSAVVHSSRRVCRAFYTKCSFYTAPGGRCTPCICFIAWLLERRRSPTFQPSYIPSLNIVQSSPLRRAAYLKLVHVCTSSIRTARKKSMPVIQKVCNNHPSPNRTHLRIPNSFSMRSLDPRPSTLLHVRQVLPAGRVPRRHVLLHAVGVASRFARRERGAGGGDAAVEAMFVEFLSE